MRDPVIRILHGDVLDRLDALRAEGARFHVIVTSPPYFALRIYEGAAPRAWPEITYVPMWGLAPVTVPAMEVSLGLEPTPEAFVAHLVHVFRRACPLLREDGALWLDLGDSYANDAKRCTGLPSKQMLGIPWRVAFALQADGWTLRSAPPWIRTNAMPDSTDDRPGNAHEQFFFLTRNPRYFYDADAVRLPAREARSRNTARTHGRDYGRVEAHRGANVPWQDDGRGRHRRTVDWFLESAAAGEAEGLIHASDVDPSIAPDDDAPRALVVRNRPHPGKHSATYPEPLVAPCLRASTSARGCCAACGAPWRRVVAIEGKSSYELSAERGATPRAVASMGRARGVNYHGKAKGGADDRTRRTVGWEPGCACGADTVPCRALDPFGGTGTTAATALRLGLDCDLIEVDATCLPEIDARLARARAARAQRALDVDAVPAAPSLPAEPRPAATQVALPLESR